MPRWITAARRGNYSVLLAVAIIALLGFGALSIDTAYMRLAQAQSQDVADAASRAALIVLRQTGDQTQARAAAERVVAENRVAGEAAVLTDLTFGNWDDTAVSPEFTIDPVVPNAVRATVRREEANAVPYLLARIWDKDRFDVGATATSATRSFQIALVVDITGSWQEGPFLDAREAVLLAHDMISNSASGVDEVGMAIFTGQYSWEYTPWAQISNPAVSASVRDDWAKLMIASKAGTDADDTDGVQCSLKSGAAINDFTSPDGGCYPDMPREYRDESGTDHSVGMLMAEQMFDSASTGAVYRAIIVLTDGQPNGTGAHLAREAAGWEETRWNEIMAEGKTTEQVRTESVATAQRLWDDKAVHTWVVSLESYQPFFEDMAQGDGYFIRTDNSGELAAIFAQIISEMPLALVE